MSSRKGQKIPEEFQEGSYTRRRGRTVNTGKTFKHSSFGKSYQKPGAPVPEPPPVPLRHHGNEYVGMDTDHSMDLNATLPTEEEVRGSYGNVLHSAHLHTCGADL
jgi:hypothetical protein